MATFRLVLTPATLFFASFGWLGSIALMLAGGVLVTAPLFVTFVVLIVVVAVILIAAFGVLRQAEQLAHRLGDPYGSVILTLTIVVIEVVLIAAVLLGPGEHTTIARDSVLSVMMIILGLVVGTSVLVGAKSGAMVRQRATVSYVAMIVALSAVAFAFPALLPAGTYTGIPAVIIAVVAMALYCGFIARQLGKRAQDYEEVAAIGAQAQEPRPSITETLATHGKEIALRTAVLLVSAVPIVLMSHDMSSLMERSFTAIGAPSALAGIVIAAIVFTPETLTTIRAARAGEFQRVVNLCLGAFVSTVGLTIPVVLVIGEITGQQIVLAPSVPMLFLVAAVIVVTTLTFRGGRTTRTRGVIPVLVFCAFLAVALSS